MELRLDFGVLGIGPGAFALCRAKDCDIFQLLSGLYLAPTTGNGKNEGGLETQIRVYARTSYDLTRDIARGAVPNHFETPSKRVLPYRQWDVQVA